MSEQKGGIVPLPDEPFVNAAGTITNLIHGGCAGSVSVLECLAGSTRSLHRHEDSHYLYVAEGRCLYYERPAGSREDVEPITVIQGQMFFTPPHVEHKVTFPVRTILVSVSSASRTHEEHEKRLTRVEWP